MQVGGKESGNVNAGTGNKLIRVLISLDVYHCPIRQSTHASRKKVERVEM